MAHCSTMNQWMNQRKNKYTDKAMSHGLFLFRSAKIYVLARFKCKVFCKHLFRFYLFDKNFMTGKEGKTSGSFTLQEIIK